MQTLGDIGEHEIIRVITQGLCENGDVLTGPGDDCAVVRPFQDANEDWVFTSDPVIEKRHFEPDTDPASIGHKAVARTLSDIAAMGATPAWALVNVVAHESMLSADLQALYAGLRNTAQRYKLAIIGGDPAPARVWSRSLPGRCGDHAKRRTPRRRTLCDRSAWRERTQEASPV